MSDDPRSLAARAAAELALVRIVHFYGQTPGFVLLGGLVPQLLCSSAALPHAGTTDIDVQVDLEISADSVGARRLELALTAAGFSPDGAVWRWQTVTSRGVRAVVKFELLADQEDHPADRVLAFVDCDHLGAANIRGTGYAARDVTLMDLEGEVEGVASQVRIRVAGLAGFLMAKVHAAKSRAKPRDWYDIAYVLLHNDAAIDGADAVLAAFGPVPEAHTALLDLRANFADSSCQGAAAYAEQAVLDDPDVDFHQAAADAVLTVRSFVSALL